MTDHPLDDVRYQGTPLRDIRAAMDVIWTLCGGTYEREYRIVQKLVNAGLTGGYGTDLPAIVELVHAQMERDSLSAAAPFDAQKATNDRLAAAWETVRRIAHPYLDPGDE